MRIPIAVILIALAVLGAIAVHPLLFLLVILTAVVLFSGRRGTGNPGGATRGRGGTAF